MDRSLLRGVGRGEDSGALASGVLELLHSMGLTVVAEGVEDEEQLRWVTARGFDRVQGFLLGRPAEQGTEPAPYLSRAVDFSSHTD